MEATYVLYAPRSRRAGLRAVLATHGGDNLVWRERKLLLGSEFYMTGPAALVRRAHTAVSGWLHQAP